MNAACHRHFRQRVAVKKKAKVVGDVDKTREDNELLCSFMAI